MEQSTEEQWKTIEEKVDKAEKIKIKSRATKINTEEVVGVKGEKKLQDLLNRKRLKALGIPEFDITIVDSALEQEKNVLESEADQLLGIEGSPERALISLRWENLVHALRDNRAIEIERSRMIDRENELLSRIDQSERFGKPTRADAIILDKVRDHINDLDNERDTLLESNPEAYFGLHLKMMKECKYDLQQGNFIETSSIKAIEEEVIEAIRIGKYPFLHGHMGSGKTEFAKFISKKLTGKSALVFSASKETSKAELIGHLALCKGEMPSVAKLIEIIDLEIKNFDEKNPDLSSEEREKKHKVISLYVVEREKTGTETVFDFGYVYKAMRDGIPLIIDEYNMIPHSIWGRMNELLKKREGDIIAVQEDGVEPFPVKKGFFFIFTGNLNQGMEQYIERADLDPAGLRRIHPIKYDYLSQYYERGANDSISLEENAGQKNELFQLILSKVMDTHGNIELPKGSMTKLWRLAMGARVSQDLFAGRFPIKKFYPKIGGTTMNQPYFLKKINIDLGRIDKILEAFSKRQDRDLDFYLWRYGISEAVDEQDKAVLFQLFKLNFNFFENWESNEDDVLSGKARELVVQPIEKKDEKVEKVFLGPREIIEFAFGKGPQRTKYPKINTYNKDNLSTDIEEFQAIEHFTREFEKDLRSLYLEEFGEDLENIRDNIMGRG